MTQPKVAPAATRPQPVPGRTVTDDASPRPAVPAQVRRVPAADDEGPLLGDLSALRASWQRIKAGFVDNPGGAVTEAADVVDEVAQRLITAVRDRRRQIREAWDGDSGARDTEAMRVALLRYEALFGHLAGDEPTGKQGE